MIDDTSPEVAALVRARLMALSGTERVIIGSRMFDAARAMILASFPKGLTEIEIKGRLCERLYGDGVDGQAFIKHLYSIAAKTSVADAVAPDEPVMES